VKATSSNAMHVDLDLAATLFGQLERATRRGCGIVRDSYGSAGASDAAAHAPSKVAGETRFVLDLRSLSEDVMEAVAAEAHRAAEQIGSQYRVSFDLGAATDSPPAMMDARLRSCLMSLLEQPLEMPSGAGHDAAVFAKAGIPRGRHPRAARIATAVSTVKRCMHS
jgi:N-carbamoyl-L-amino-acid hydrolase